MDQLFKDMGWFLERAAHQGVDDADRAREGLEMLTRWKEGQSKGMILEGQKMRWFLRITTRPEDYRSLGGNYM